MKRFIYTAIAFIAMSMATSCEKDVINTTSGEGGFSLTLNVNDNAQTRALTDEQKNTLINSSSVKIYKPNFMGLIREYTYNLMPDIVYLPSIKSNEKYRVDVIAGEAATKNPRKANFDAKSYAGSAEFNIAANKITTGVSVTAKISNAITAVTLDKTIFDNFGETYSLTFTLPTIEGGSAKTLVYNKDIITKNVTSGSSVTKEGYFIIDNPAIENKLCWTFSGTKISDGTTFTANGEIEAPEGGLIGTRHTMLFKYVVKDGTLIFDLTVNSTTESITDNIIWTPTSTGISTLNKYDVWAKFANVKADVDTKTYNKDKVYFQWRNVTDNETFVEPTAEGAHLVKAVESTTEAGVFTAAIKGLTPETKYEYRLVVYTDATPEAIDSEILSTTKDFTTESAQEIPNGGFEEFTMNTNYKSHFPEFFNTSSSIESHRTKWWDSGNIASADYSTVISTTDKGIIGNYSALLQSKEAMGMNILAAGNLFSGSFGGTEQITNGIVNFGRPFTSRPTGIRFYIRYQSGKVDKKHDSLGNYDEGQFKVALGTWPAKKYVKNTEKGDPTNSPIQVRTYYKETFWDIANLEETIVYKDIILGGDNNQTPGSNGADSGWMKITWKFDNYTATPSHIIISGAASRFGDYFKGSFSSKMWLDEIELLYDHPDDITEGTVTMN